MTQAIRRFALGLLALTLLAVGTAQEDWDQTRLEEGENIYRTVANVGCSTCHGAFALGDLGIGPAIRGVDEVRIEGALEGAEEMGFLIPIMTDEMIADVAYYLAYLDTLHPVLAQFRQEAFTPAEITVPADTDVQVIVENGNRSPCTLQVSIPDTEPVEIDGRATDGLVVRTPANGQVTATCTESPSAVLTLNVGAAD